MITVVSPGARTLIEDLGRTGHEHLGVPTSGAADRDSMTLGNILAGNPATAAVFEIALAGPTLTFETDTTVAYTGADTDLFLDHTPVPVGHTLHVRAGQTLSIGTLRGGIFGYLAVNGGLVPTPVLGSRSACTLSGLGPQPLTVGDTIPIGAASQSAHLALRSPRVASTPTIRYLPGPHTSMFDTDALKAFHDALWTVSPDTSRVGIRLAGAPLHAPQDSLPSLGMPTGAIQVPPNGRPIVLGVDHGTTGGYPVLGVVLPADMATLAQKVPGSPVQFRAVSAEQALAAGSDPRSLVRLDAISV